MLLRRAILLKPLHAPADDPDGQVPVGKRASGAVVADGPSPALAPSHSALTVSAGVPGTVGFLVAVGDDQRDTELRAKRKDRVFRSNQWRRLVPSFPADGGHREGPCGIAVWTILELYRDCGPVIPSRVSVGNLRSMSAVRLFWFEQVFAHRHDFTGLFTSLR